jgi:2-amino-4-hydroxy-6-hydroxymethyldihydropteridine diphosphokinase
MFIALGGNLPHPRHGAAENTLTAALARIAESGCSIARRSGWWRSAPVPASDQPWFVNGVARIVTARPPAALLALLHAIEAEFGRVRHRRWEARVLDLDLIDYDGRVDPGPAPCLPHPRLAERAFVLLPLAEIAPDWRDPRDGRPIADLIAALPPGQIIERCRDP